MPDIEMMLLGLAEVLATHARNEGREGSVFILVGEPIPVGSMSLEERLARTTGKTGSKKSTTIRRAGKSGRKKRSPKR